MGFWYDVQCENVRVEDLTSVDNEGDGLFIELSHGPFDIERLLSAGNAGHPFNMSIVGSFTLRDSILYGNRSGTMKLKDVDVPWPLVNLQWYQRNDEHARKYFGPEHFRLENNLFLGGPQQRGVVIEHNGLGRDDPRYKTYSYEGKNNLFYSSVKDKGFAYVDPSWQPVQTDLRGWQARTSEVSPLLSDPKFRDAARLDFRLLPSSPLAPRAASLPLRRIDPLVLAEAKRFKTWAQAGLPPAQD
jgi:hypothetical protein